MSEEAANPKIIISDEEKTSFFKAFLKNEPYTSEESLFGGELRLKFRSLTVDETKDAFNQMRIDQDSNVLTNDANYMIQLTNYRLALSLAAINDEEFSTINKKTYKPEDENDSYVKARAASLNSWPMFKLSAFVEAYKIFEDKLLQLTREVSSENFWKAGTDIS